jgi:hypothetical protein
LPQPASPCNHLQAERQAEQGTPSRDWLSFFLLLLKHCKVFLRIGFEKAVAVFVGNHLPGKTIA